MEKGDLIDKIKEKVHEIQSNDKYLSSNEKDNSDDFFNKMIFNIDDTFKKDESIDSMTFLQSVYEHLLDFINKCNEPNLDTNLDTEITKFQINYLDSFLKYFNTYIEKRKSENTQEEPKETKEIISIGSKKVECHHSIKDKVTHTIFTEKDFIPDSSLYDILVAKKGKKEITTKVSVLTNVESFGKLTRYDKAVFSAVISNMDAGNEVMTIPMIIRAMKPNIVNISDARKESVYKSLRRLMTSYISLDISDEQLHLDYKNLNELRYAIEGNVLPAKFVKREEYKINGQVILSNGAIKLYEEPILYQYAKAKNQIQRTDIKYFDTPLKLTDKSIVLIELLDERIGKMEHQKSKKKLVKGWNIILFDYIYEHLDSETAFEQKRTRESTEKILDDWKMKKRIKDFEMIKEKRTVKKVKILF